MPSQVIVICAAALLALGGIWVLISGFDDDNDGDGMTFPEFQKVPRFTSESLIVSRTFFIRTFY